MYGYLSPDLATAESGATAMSTQRSSALPHRPTMRLARGLVMAMLAMFLSLLIVAADQAMGRWWQAGTTVSLLVLWTIVFGCLALLARWTGRFALRLALAMSRWRSRRNTAVTDQQGKNSALEDLRVKADVEAALAAGADSSAAQYVAPRYCRYL